MSVTILYLGMSSFLALSIVVSSFCIVAKLWKMEDTINPIGFSFVVLSNRKAFIGSF